MSKKKLIIILVLIVVVSVCYFYFRTKGEESGGSQLPNPAAVYCGEQGGVLKSIIFEAGVKTSCLFEDGSECNQWDFYNGKCQEGELKKEVLREGTGRRADNGDTVVVHYTGKLEDGTKFDSSLDRGQPFSFVLGQGRVIQGWEEGVLGMRAGEKRNLTIAPRLAYGEAGFPDAIPPNATLTFEVELLGIKQ